MKTRTFVVSSGAALAALLLLAEATDPCAAAALYTITPIEGPAGDCQVLAINNAGQLAGIAFGSGREGSARGFRMTDGKFELLPALDEGGASQAFAINARGAIAGWALDGSGTARAVRGFGEFAVEGAAANSNGARAINDAGDVAGTLGDDHGNERAFVYTAGGAQVLLAGLGGSTSRAFGINSTGAVVGDAALADELVRHAALWDRATGKAFDLGALAPGRSSMAYAINDQGEAVGAAEDASGMILPVRFAGGKAEALSDRWGRAFAVNCAGDLVGAFADNHAFAVIGGTLLDLEQVIPEESGWRLWHASGINDAGTIAGWGFLNGRLRGFVMTPTTGAVTEASNAAPAVLRFRAQPSVTSGGTMLGFGMPAPGPSRVMLYSVAGRRVRALEIEPGEAQIAWDGRDEAGQVVGSGLLFARLEGALGSAITRVFIVR